MYTDKHKYFLQHLLSVGCMSIEGVSKIIDSINDKLDDGTEQDLQSLLSNINEKIGEQSLKIIETKCEVTGLEKVILLNLSQDEPAKCQGVYTPVQLEYFQMLLSDVVASETKSLSHIHCLNCTSNLTLKLSRAEAEVLLIKWSQYGYLVIVDGNVFLGPRMIMEFTSHFHTHLKDFTTTCYLCSELVFVGKTCSKCTKRMHNHCIQQFLTNRKTCPKCKRPWRPVEDVENGIDDSSSDSQSDQENSIVAQKRARTARK